MSTTPVRQTSRDGRRKLTVLVAGAVGATALVVPLALSAGAAGTTLATAAASSGRYFGTAMSGSAINNGTDQRVAAAEFNMVTAENEMKPDATEPNQNQFNFNSGDAIFNWA